MTEIDNIQPTNATKIIKMAAKIKGLNKWKKMWNKTLGVYIEHSELKRICR